MFITGPIADPNVKPENEDSDDEDDDRRPECVFSLVASDQIDVPIFGVLLKRDGEVVMYRKYPRIMARARHDNHPHFKQKSREIQMLRELIETKRPFSIVIAANSMRARDLEKIVGDILSDLHHDHPEYRCNIELRDPLVAKVTHL